MTERHPETAADPAAIADQDLEQVTGGDAATLLPAVQDTTVQSANIGSQSSGAGAGKITFNPFSITRK